MKVMEDHHTKTLVLGVMACLRSLISRVQSFADEVSCVLLGGLRGTDFKTPLVRPTW